MNRIPDRLARIQSTNVRRLFLGLLLGLVVPAVVAAQATKVTSSEGRYTAIFPGPANRIVDPPKTVNGLTFSLEYYRAVSEQQIFMTAFTHYTGGVIDIPKELQLNVDNLVKGLSGRLLSTKPIDYVLPTSKIAGIEFTCETDQFTFHGRFYAAGSDVWGIVYGAPLNGGSAVVKEQFFQSLAINPAETKGDHR
jgi:hypothetical protein